MEHAQGPLLVGGLSEIDVIVWMHRMFCAPRGAEYFIGAIGNDFIDIHVGLGTGPCLPDRQGKFAIETPVSISRATAAIAEHIPLTKARDRD